MKPKLEENSIIREVAAKLNVKLGADFDRYSNGTILMTATHATFKSGGEDGSVSMDLGGTVLEVAIGRRRWRVDVSDIVSAVLESDEQYVKDNPITEEA